MERTSKTSQVLRYILQALVPLVILAVAGGTAYLISQNPAEQPKSEPVTAPPPLVETLELRVVNKEYKIHTQGTVQDRRQVTLAPQVGGRVEFASPALVSGGAFRKGDVLLQIEDVDYTQAVSAAELSLAQAEEQLMREHAEARIAIREWRSQGREGDPPPLGAREPQLRAAKARVAAAEAQLQRARRDLTRTELRAPFDGRVRSATVNTDDIVAPNAPVAQLYATDIAEVRVSVPISEVPYINLPFRYDQIAPTARSSMALDEEKAEEAVVGTPAVVQRRVGSKIDEWEGTVSRTEGTIDPRTRTITAIVLVPGPYQTDTNGDGTSDRLPLIAGDFVEVDLIGRVAENVFVIPRAHVVQEAAGRVRVYVIEPGTGDGDEEMRRTTEELIEGSMSPEPAQSDSALRGRLRILEVDVLRGTPSEVVVAGSQLPQGNQMIVSTLASPVEDMVLRYRTLAFTRTSVDPRFTDTGRADTRGRPAPSTMDNASDAEGATNAGTATDQGGSR